MKLRRAVLPILLAALLPAAGAARAAATTPRDGDEPAARPALTSEERREAGEFLLALDARWRGAQSFSSVLDELFVPDLVALSRANPLGLRHLPARAGVVEQLTDAELKRAYAAHLDLAYLGGRLFLTYEKAKRHERAAKAEAAREAGGPATDEDEDDDEPSMEEALSPAVLEVIKSNPLLAAGWLEDDDGASAAATRDATAGTGDATAGGTTGAAGEDEKGLAATPAQLMELTAACEQAARLMRERLKDLESKLPGGSFSAVPREDEDEGEGPELRLNLLDAAWMNRPAGTRVVCGYVSILHVDLVKENGRYRVLAAYIED